MPSLTTASLRVFDLSLGEMLWSRRTVFLALVVGGPVLIAIILRVVDALNVPAMRVNGVRLGGPSIFGLMLWFLFLRFIVPVLGIFYGTSLMADEVEDKTITYLFTRPIPRSAVLIGKYLAYLASTVLIVLPSVMLVYFLVVPIGGGAIAATFPTLLRDLALLAIGLAVYGALFAAVGAWIKRPVLVGLFFAFGWENFALALPGYMKRFTVAFYTQSLVPARHAPGQPAVDPPVGLQGQCVGAAGGFDPGRAARGRPGAGHPGRGAPGIRAGAIGWGEFRNPFSSSPV